MKNKKIKINNNNRPPTIIDRQQSTDDAEDSESSSKSSSESSSVDEEEEENGHMDDTDSECNVGVDAELSYDELWDAEWDAVQRGDHASAAVLSKKRVVAQKRETVAHNKKINAKNKIAKIKMAQRTRAIHKGPA